MFTPAEAIAELDAAIAQAGQTVMLERLVPNAASVTQPMRAFSRGYKPDELANGVQQGDSLVVLSPSQLVGTPFATEMLVANNKIEINGRRRNIQMVDPVYMNDVLVRINLQVRG